MTTLRPFDPHTHYGPEMEVYKLLGHPSSAPSSLLFQPSSPLFHHPGSLTSTCLTRARVTQTTRQACPTMKDPHPPEYYLAEAANLEISEVWVVLEKGMLLAKLLSSAQFIFGSRLTYSLLSLSRRSGLAALGIAKKSALNTS